MIGNLMARAGLALLRKSFSFTANQSEEIRKFFATHPNIARAVGYAEPSYSGKQVSEYSALNISTVWACQRVISESVSTLPLHVMQEADGSRRVASEHPLDWVLYREPNSEMSALRVRQTMTAHALTWGNAWALKVKRGGTGQTIGLWPWTPDSVRGDVDRAGNRVWLHRDGSAGEKIYPAADVFHLPGLGFDGRLGYSVISMARQSLGLAAVQDEYAARFFAQGGRRPYYLKKASRFRTETEFDEFRSKWNETYAGSDGFHKAPILEGDIELKELGMPLEDLQLLEARQYSVPEICRWFRISPHLVGDLSRATFSNIEHLALEFVQQTLMYWLVLWEQEIERQLLTDGEKRKNYYVKHNVSALLRGDFKSRMEGYSIGLQNGFMSPDDVRGLEDWDPLPGGAGRAYHIQLNMQTLPGTGEPTTAEQAQIAKLQGVGNASQTDRPLV